MTNATWNMKTRSDGDWELPPAGNSPAVCVALIDLGTQQDSFQGKPREAHQLALVWELAGTVSTKTERPHLVCAKFNASLHAKANLRKTLESWRGAPIRDDEEFDIFKVVGAPCLLQISHDKTASGNDIYSIDAVTALPRGMPRPQATCPLIRYRIDMGPEKVPAETWLPMLFGKSIGDRVRECLEFARPRATAAPAPASRPAAAPASEAHYDGEPIPF